MTPAALVALLSGDEANARIAMTPGGIDAQEAAGQQALINSSTLPIDAPWEDLEALGFKRGKEVDDCFCECEMPTGWKKVATDHSMWSDLIDADGQKRGAIFYKAAFYDRSAYLYLSGK